MIELCNGKVILYHGNCLDILKDIQPVHACVTDPPYHLSEMTKRFGKKDAKPCGAGKDGSFRRLSKGFMGQTWDGGDISFKSETWETVGNALLPGAHLLSFAGTRTYHRIACAIEDAGFEIRDTIAWLYGQGLPKSMDISKAIDKAAGVEREVVGKRPEHVISKKWREQEGRTDLPISLLDITAPATDEAKELSGWGTALKPAMEPICVARKPVSEKTVAKNVLKHGTGGINIDECRVDTRFPANVIHDGSEEVLEVFPDTKSGTLKGNYKSPCKNVYGEYSKAVPYNYTFNEGSAARFFYCAKASSSERGEDNKHPTVKPIDLMAYLCRLVTPKNGIVLDPFMGSGTTAIAALREGFQFIGIEQNEDYFNIAVERIKNTYIPAKLDLDYYYVSEDISP